MMASDASAEEQRSHSVHKASEKRRAQNRAAQKTYREKRKKRLQELEELAAAAGLVDKQGSPPEHESPNDPDSGDAASPIGFPFADTSTALMATFDVSPFQQPYSKVLLPTEPRVYEVDRQSIEDHSFNNINNNDLLWPTLSGSPSTSLVQTASYSSFSDFSSTSPTGCHIISSSSSDTSGSDEVVVRSAAYLHSDPQINAIWFQTTAVYAAYLQNMLHLGIMVEDPCMDDLVSLFYTPQAIQSKDPDALVKIVQNNYSNVKPDLRPTRAQIMRKHPAYLDVLPFPELRDRLIELLTHDPPLMDEEEFLRDVEAGGVVCWGSTAAGGQGPAGCGAPWDARSGEAKTWFLNKWNWLIPDESDLARNSAWWRTMRGHQQGVSF
jgi:hypothetical protein